MRPTLKVVAGVLAALLAAASMVLAAGASQPRTMTLACAKKGSGALQYVKRAGDCPSSSGKLVRFPADAPVDACQKTAGGALFRVAGPSACRPPKRPGTNPVVLPKTTNLKLCAARGDGAVRAVAAFSRCKTGEPHVVLEALKAPRAVDDSSTTGEETPRAIAVLANDSGARPLHVASLDASATKGSVAKASNGTVRYSPNGRFNSLRAGQTGHDSFRYRASDGVHDSNAATVRVTLTGVNDPPHAADDAASTDKDTPAAITVLSNDTDPDGEALSVASLDATGTKGTVTKNPDGTVTYDPNGQFDSLAPGDSAHDTFAYRANDGHADSGPATVDVTVSGLDHAPTVATSGGATGYLEGDPATVVDSGVTVTDDDDANIESATVAITSGFEAGDKLQVVPQNGIGGGFDAGTGVLTLTGHASKADYQTALRSVKFATQSDNPATSKTVSFSASDGELDSAPDTKALAVARVNDAPSVATSGGSLAYAEGSGALAVDGGVAVSDPDSSTLSGATVRVSSSFQAAEDELGFTDANGISGSYDDSTGTLTLTGAASPSAYQAALRSVTYTNSSDNPGASRTISFRVIDSASSGSNTATRTIALSGFNDAPAVTTSAGSTPYTEGAAATAVDAALTVADPDNANLASAKVSIVGLEPGDELQFSTQNGISGSYDSGTGVMTLTGSASQASYRTALRSVAFRTTNDNPSATRTIEFRASDGALQSAAASKTVAVGGANDAPAVTTSGGSLGYTEGAGPLVIDGGAAIADPDSANMSGAKVSISSGFAAADDELSFADANGIAGSYNDTTGVLTLSGTASRAAYETALRSVRYENVSQDPSGTRTVTFQVTDDGALPSNGATRQIALTGVNDAPTVTTSGGSTAYTEGAGATAVDSAVTLTDPDDTSIEGATARISAGLRPGDLLAVAGQNGITGSYDSGSGTLTLSGTASKANYQAALASVTFRSTSDDPGTARTVELSASDGGASSAAATKSIAVTPVNDAPALTTSSGPLTYTEAAGPVAIDPGIVLADPDSANMSGATVTISAGFVAAQDELSFSTQNGIGGSYDDTTGTMTLSGAATRAQYETALRSVKYENSSDDPTDSRTVSFQVTDSSSAAGNTATRDIDINGVSDPPVVSTTAGSTAYTEGDAATEVDAGLTVSDSDDSNLDSAKVRISAGLQTGDELSLATQNGISGSYDSGTGVLTVSGATSKANYETALRSVKFRTTNDAPTTSRTIEFTVNDGDADSAPASKGVTITPTNDAPTVTTTAGSLGYTEGAGAAAIDPGLTVADPDSADMSGAEVKITSGFVAAQDELSFSTQNGITGAYDDTTGTMTLSGAATRAQYETALRSVTYTNVSDDPSPSRTVSFKATDSSSATGPAATRGIAVTAVNDAPVVTTTNGSTPVTEDAAATAVDTGVTVSDVDDASLEGATVRVSAGLQTGDVLAVATQNGISGTYDSGTGTLTLSGSSTVAHYQTALQSVTFRTTNNDPGATRTIEFKASDGDTTSGPATKALAVTGSNDAPVITTTGTALAYVENDGQVPVDNGLTVADPDSANMTGATVRISSNFVQAEDGLGFQDQNGITGAYDDTTGTLTLSGSATRAQYETALRSVTYANSSDDPSGATRTVTFRVVDDASAASDPASRSVTVSRTNDAPVVTPSNGSTPYTEGDAATTIDSAVTVSDADDTTLAGGTVSMPSGFQQGADELHFSDANGIAGVYHADTGVLALSGASSVANYQAALRSITYRHTGDAPVASKTVAFKVKDGAADSNAPTKEIAVTAVNDAPAVTMTSGALAYAENDGPKPIDTGLDVSDPDSAQLSGAAVSVSANFSSAQDQLAFSDQNGISGAYDDSTGVLTLSGTATAAQYRTALRSVTYENVSDAPSPASRTISVTARDSANATSTAATRGISISASNDAPSAVDDAKTTDEDTAVNEPAPGVLGNDTDPDGVPPDTRTVVKLNGSTTLTGTSAKGAPVTIGAGGSYTYDPSGVAEFQALSTGGPSGSDSFTYTMEDGSGAQSTATVNLTITGVSDAPTAVDDTFNTNGNTVLFAGTTRPATQAGRQISASVLSNDTDPDSGGLSASPVTDEPTFLGGKVTIESDGNFTYTPPTGQEGVSDSFTYTVTDGVASDSGSVTIPLAERAWYVKNDAVAGGTGRSSDPFDTLAEAETASNANDTTYVFHGDGTSTAYDTGYAMNSAERLIGEASDLTMDPDGAGPLAAETYFSGNAANRPNLTASNEDVVVLASGGTVRGLQLDPSGTGGGIFGSSGTSGGTVADVRVIDTGTPGGFAGFELLNTSGTFDVSNLTVSMTAAGGVRVSNAGTVNFAPTGTIAISTVDGKALDAIGTNMGTGSQFDSLTATASTSGGVSLINTSGTTSLGDGTGTDLALTTTSSTAAALFMANAGTVSVPGAGTANINAAGGPAVDVNGTPAVLDLDSVSSTGSATDGINLDGLGAGTFSASSGDVQGATSRGFRANSGTGDISYGGSISDGPGSTAAITGRSGGTVTLSGSLADGSDAGGGIAISGNSGGASVFSHGSKVINAGSGDGVLMTNNTGHSVTFSGGGLGIAATSGKGMEAMGGGTLTVTGSGNTIDTATGRTLNVDSTNIGSDGLNFRSIGAGTAAGGPVNGIRLNGTGGAGSLFVSGGGTAGSGGTIQKTTGDGVSLKDTTAPTLAYMAIYDSADNGIAADSVSDLAIQYDDLQRNGAQAEAGAVNDAGIHLGNITGTSAILVTNVSDSHNSNIDWDASSGTGRLNVAASTIDSSGENPGEGGAGVSLTATGTASPYLNLSSANEVNSNNQEGVRVSSDSGTPTARVENSDVKSNGGAGVNLTASGTAQALYRVSGSNLQGNGGRSIALNSSGTPAVDGSVSGNTIGTSGVAGSGSGSAEAVFAELDDGTNGALAVTGNTIFAPATAGIAVFSADQSGTEVAPIDLTIRDNTVGPPTTAANGHGVDVFAGGNNHVCLDIAGNDADGVGGTEHQFEDLHVKQSGTSTFSLERFTGDGADDSAVESFLLAQNPASDTADAEHTTGFTGVDDATCQSPELP